MEWSLYPELAQTLGTSSQCSFDFSSTGNMGTSPGDTDDSGLNLGVGATEMLDLLADTEIPSLSDVLAWESWDLGELSTGASNTATAETTPPPNIRATLLALADNNNSTNGSDNSGSGCSSGRSSRSRSRSPGNAASTTLDCSSPTKPCIAAAAGVISTLHTCTDMCLLSPSSSPFSSPLLTLSSASPNINHDSLHRRDPGPRTIDTILTDGRDAARAISATLNCSACFSKPQLHLLTATALEKLAGWYRAVIEDLSSGVGAGSVLEDASMHHYPSHGPPPLTIAIGTHAVEETLQAAVVAQVVMQRLRELKCMVELLARRMGGGAADGPNSIGSGSGNSEEDGRLPPAVRDKLVARVRQRLVTAWEELAVLREGQLRCGVEESLWSY
ncbi:hypothetical protein P885DRAFT_62003 [Corynascus similis CBS 632.67]